MSIVVKSRSLAAWLVSLVLLLLDVDHGPVLPTPSEPLPKSLPPSQARSNGAFVQARRGTVLLDHTVSDLT